MDPPAIPASVPAPPEKRTGGGSEAASPAPAPDSTEPPAPTPRQKSRAAGLNVLHALGSAGVPVVGKVARVMGAVDDWDEARAAEREPQPQQRVGGFGAASRGPGPNAPSGIDPDPVAKLSRGAGVGSPGLGRTSDNAPGGLGSLPTPPMVGGAAAGAGSSEQRGGGNTPGNAPGTFGGGSGGSDGPDGLLGQILKTLLDMKSLQEKQQHQHGAKAAAGAAPHGAKAAVGGKGSAARSAANMAANAKSMIEFGRILGSAAKAAGS